MKKYLELELDLNEIEYLMKYSSFNFEQIILQSLRKLKNTCLKNRVKDCSFGINVGHQEMLHKLLRLDILQSSIYFKKLGFDFVNFNLARFPEYEYSDDKKANPGPQKGLSKAHCDAYHNLVDRLKDKLEFTAHLPTDKGIYLDPEDKLFENTLHLANKLSKKMPQKKFPLCFHAYRKRKSSDMAKDLTISKEKTADLIVRTAQYIKHLETKGEIKFTLALEMLNQELPTSHYIRYCVTPHQVLEAYDLAIAKDPEGLVQKYLDKGIFSVTFDVGHFLLDQKFQEMTLNKPTTGMGNPLYYGFDEFSRRISLYHISGIVNPDYLHNYLDHRRSKEFLNKFDKEYTHHCPLLISDAQKVGEVLKQVEIFSGLDNKLLTDLPDSF